MLQFPLCTTILTFAPQFWHLTPSWKKRLLWRGKTQKKLPKFFWRLRDTYKKYILQKNWSKTAIPALSSGPSNLQQSIWGRHHQLDDQHRNPNISNKDHLVGQLTKDDDDYWDGSCDTQRNSVCFWMFWAKFMSAVGSFSWQELSWTGLILYCNQTEFETKLTKNNVQIYSLHIKWALLHKTYCKRHS